MSSSKINSLDGISQSLVLIGGDRILSGVLRRVCCWWVAAEHQLPDDICVEWSIDSLVVVDQGDELCSHQCKFRFDGSQAGRHLFKFGLGFGITDERLEVLLHTILNKSADGIVLLSDAADLASKGGLQRWGQCRIVPLC